MNFLTRVVFNGFVKFMFKRMGKEVEGIFMKTISEVYELKELIAKCEKDGMDKESIKRFLSSVLKFDITEEEYSDLENSENRYKIAVKSLKSKLKEVKIDLKDSWLNFLLELAVLYFKG